MESTTNYQKILKKPFLTAKDIAVLTEVSIAQAYEIIKRIKAEEGIDEKRCPRRCTIPTFAFENFFGLNKGRKDRT